MPSTGHVDGISILEPERHAPVGPHPCSGAEASDGAWLCRSFLCGRVTLDGDLVLLLSRSRQLERHLKAQPHISRRAEGLFQPDRHLRADAGLLVDEVVQRLASDAEHPRTL